MRIPQICSWNSATKAAVTCSNIGRDIVLRRRGLRMQLRKHCVCAHLSAPNVDQSWPRLSRTLALLRHASCLSLVLATRLDFWAEQGFGVGVVALLSEVGEESWRMGESDRQGVLLVSSGRALALCGSPRVDAGQPDVTQRMCADWPGLVRRRAQALKGLVPCIGEVASSLRLALRRPLPMR